MRIRRALQAAVIGLVVYAGSYLLLRHTHIETWDRDGHAYVIIPVAWRVLYYLYRPMMYLDGAATGMRFHIGPHR